MTTIDLAPIVNQVVIPLLAPVVLALAVWALNRLAALLHIKLQDSQRAVLSAAVTNGIAYAEHALAGKEHITIDDRAAAAVDYVLPKVPGALKSLGVTPDHLSQLVTAQLAAVPAAK